MTKVKYAWMCDTDFVHELSPDNKGYVDIYPNKEAFLKEKASHFVPAKDTTFVCKPVKVKIEIVNETDS